MKTPLPTLRVLLLDDHRADAELAVAALERNGLAVSADIVTTQTDFTAMVKRAEYDVILADYNMPGWSGTDALAAVRRMGVDAPVILVTGTLGDEAAVECVKQGIADYVLKDNLSRLPMAVRRALADIHAQRERARVDAQFTQLAQTIEEVFFVVDAQYRETIYINPAYETVWGRSCASLYESPRSFLDAVHPDDRDAMAAYIGRIQSGENAGKIEFRVVHADGNERRVLAHAVGIRDAHGAVYRISGVALDVTESRKLETQLSQAQKMDAIGRLAGGVAHDFNNLLTVITGYSEMMLSEMGAHDPRGEDLREIVRAAESATSLTRQLLAFSRDQIVEPRVVVLDEVLGAVDKMLRRLIGEDIKLVTDFGAPLARVKIDPGQLEQVVLNLSVNARDAMPEGGTLSFATRTTELRAEDTSTQWPATPGEYIMLAVTDSGVGMSRETRARIFEPFFTTKEVGKGTGLGLATVYGVMQQAGGLISVASEPGKGTTFRIYFPVSHEEANAPAAGTTDTDVAPPATILLTEDAPGVRMAVRRILERSGFSVLEAPGGVEALAIAKRHAGDIDLLITDVVMPGMSGRSVAEQFSAYRPNAAVLYVSGYTNDAVILREIRESGVAFLQKPFAPEVLVKKVRDLLRR